ncbi:uncharacterized protein BDR25DRAFT_346155 [Lindgomyces ingoldianus]|uniref:Uncharacterized protein n=1 Tax=Lindgomyces ingoldianus TaxID=673940 RepID=A0ACB6QFK9_9PLEO|nr:uncharacterized protein BDR25DRAFT_346155 [Lindgomyces ingoldianus]KAF2465660.1 hypothetical protein BDR25DRAFT_346155 [Lindgomyces ingoldianus]
MRLLRRSSTSDFSLEDFASDNTIPPYAILSHTWGTDTDEVTFEDLISGTGKNKPGFEKIRFRADQAWKDGLQYFWIDTCCTIQTHHRRQCPTKRVAYAAENGGKMPHHWRSLKRDPSNCESAKTSWYQNYYMVTNQDNNDKLQNSWWHDPLVASDKLPDKAYSGKAKLSDDPVFARESLAPG